MFVPLAHLIQRSHEKFTKSQEFIFFFFLYFKPNFHYFITYFMKERETHKITKDELFFL
jgi:hypothetical protein